MHTVVERELELKLILSPERSIPVPARLSYRSDDPYAVHVAFHIGSDHPVNWTFARELLVEGVFRPCGHGDVRVWPTKVDRRSVVVGSGLSAVWRRPRTPSSMTNSARVNASAPGVVTTGTHRKRAVSSDGVIVVET